MISLVHRLTKGLGTLVISFSDSEGDMNHLREEECLGMPQAWLEGAEPNRY